MAVDRTVPSRQAGSSLGLDLRAWLDELARIGELVEIDGADLELEIGALTDLNAKRRGPALLFTHIEGAEDGGRLLSCSLSRAARLASALGLPHELSDYELVEALRGQPAIWQERASRFPPRVVQKGPVQENILVGDEVDMRRFPAPLWHEGDGGRYLGTGGAVITRDAESGNVNAGTYRVSVHDARRLGLFIEPINHGAIHIQTFHERGEPAPVAVSFGHGPVVHLASSMPMPYSVEEFAYAGAVAEQPLDVIEGEMTGLPIPAYSELAIEGWIHPGNEDLEGPFGEFTGYFAGGRTMRPVIDVERVYFRDDPIVYGSLPGKPPFDHSYWRAAIESAMLVDELGSAGVAGVTAAWKYEVGSANFFTVVSIKQRYAGHSIQAGMAALLVSGGVSMGRYVVVVDHDVDVMDLEEVIWCISSRSDPATNIQTVRDTPTNPLDPMLEDETGPWLGSRAVIDACRPFSRLQDFPQVVEVSKPLAERVTAKWGSQLGWGA